MPFPTKNRPRPPVPHTPTASFQDKLTLISVTASMALKRFKIVVIVAILALALGYYNGALALNLIGLLNLKEILFTGPYAGPEVVVEIIGADLNRRANRFFDRWSQPDTFATIEHGNTERHTQIEGNTYQPRYLWKTKMPYEKTKGMRFVVQDANVFSDNDVMGRAFIDTDRIAIMMRTMEPGLLSLGENIGVLKIAVTPVPANLKAKKGVFSLKPTVKQLDEL